MAFECPRGTRFQQRTMVCDHEHLVECHQSAKYFHSNLRIGQANVNFIDDKQRLSSSMLQIKNFSDIQVLLHYLIIESIPIYSSGTGKLST